MNDFNITCTTAFVFGILVGVIVAGVTTICIWHKSCVSNARLLLDVEKEIRNKAEIDSVQPKNWSFMYGFGFADGLILGRQVIKAMASVKPYKFDIKKVDP